MFAHRPSPIAHRPSPSGSIEVNPSDFNGTKRAALFAANKQWTRGADILLEDGQVVDRYQSLMNAGVRIPVFIESLSGITNSMIRSAPSPAQVMCEVASFVGDIPLVAHNASFDSKFWDAELALINQRRRQEFACSLLLARRILPQAPSHKLGDLIQFANLPRTVRTHRALADAEMAASLLQHLEEQLCSRFKVRNVSHELLRRIQSVPRAKLEHCMVQRQQSH